jgi:hypothetical protein
MSAAMTRTIAANEMHALLPTWIASVLTATIAGLTGGDVHRFSMLACVAATAGLGAQSIGHEYGHRTLNLMLTLPVSRRRLFLVKLAVLGALVVPLAAYAWLMGLFDTMPALMPWLVAAGPVCFAPALTMLCRSQLAGLIFTLSLPGTALVAVMIATGTPLSAPPPVAPWSRLMVLLLPGFAVLGWRLFMRLEAIEGDVAAIHVPSWIRAKQAVAPTHPLWQLVKKELHLQQMTFAITALYLAGCAAAALLRAPRLGEHVSFIGAMTAVYELGLSVLVGSLATAEERQLGTLAWQLQLPSPAWQQWAVKVGVVFTVMVLGSIGVPSLLAPALWPDGQSPVDMPLLLVIVMTAASMYVSSLCTTAVRGAVTSVVALSFVFWLVFNPELWTGRAPGSVTLLSLVAALLAGFAFVNHKPEQPTAARIARQILSIAALVAIGLVIVGAARS